VKNFYALAATVLFVGSISYFKYQRPVEVSGTGQRYIAVDENIWRHSRSDLGDLRLYSNQSETPYALITESGSEQRQRTTVPVLQQSTVSRKTQFLVDMSALAEYDHVNLSLASKNFVAHADVEGSDDLHGKQWAALGDSILYDLSKENLGGNNTLRLPRSTYKYLRVNIDGPVKPQDVEGAVSEMAEEQPAVWRDVGITPKQEQGGKDTVFTFDVAGNVAVERVTFSLDSEQPTFQRSVEIQNENGAGIGSGEINRIHMVRDGQKIDSEDQVVSFSANGQKIIKVVIRNGDDPPLKLAGIRLQQLERRIYFDIPAQGQLTLYYGDEKLEQPVYDYAKLFLRDKTPVAAQLGPEASNSAYTGRPDERPWSERHPAVLWVVIVVAVLVLGGVALRSMRSATA
jgi:hypothetical protein